jgi:hypothetical protein
MVLTVNVKGNTESMVLAAIKALWEAGLLDLDEMRRAVREVQGR